MTSKINSKIKEWFDLVRGFNYLKQTMKNCLWIDLEMTGLDETKDVILELAAVVTNYALDIKEEYQQIVYQPKEVLDNMNDWCKEHHGKSGLTAAVPKGKPLEHVEKDVLDLIGRHFKRDERPVLAGNSIWNDRKFIDRYMPGLSKRLHYRMIDVSSFKEIYREQYGIKFEKANAHRAVGDIQESIKELKHYLAFVQIPQKT